MHLFRTLFLLHLMLTSPAVLAAPQTLPTDALELRKMAERYEHGRGVKQDYPKANRLYCLAALKGDINANYQLGWMHFNSRGVNRDDALAAGWFQRAADLGDPHALKMLDRLTTTTAKPDTSCILKNPTQQQIEQWVKLWAPEYGLDAELVLAVIATESNFVTKAKSPKGALGLMQLIPATARRFGVKDTFDPVDNMHGGMAYLRWLLEYFNGEVDFALAGYNAGEHAVKRYQGIPPYRETVNYIRRIAKLHPRANRQASN